MPGQRVTIKVHENALTPALLCALSLLTFSAAAIDDTRLLGAHEDHDNWLTYGHGYANQRYSALDQIDAGNVERLVPKWIYQTGVLGTFPTSPIVANGVMYLSTPYNHVVALDAATGKQRWRYTHEDGNGQAVLRVAQPRHCMGLRAALYDHGRRPLARA